METTLSAGIPRKEIWGCGAEVQGLANNFLSENGGGGFGKVSIQEESVSNMFGSRH